MRNDNEAQSALNISIFTSAWLVTFGWIMKNIGCADLHRASRDAILSNNLIKYSFMGKCAHCEVFRRHSDVPPFFSEDPSQPSLQREGVVSWQILPQLIALPSWGELEGSILKKNRENIFKGFHFFEMVVWARCWNLKTSFPFHHLLTPSLTAETFSEINHGTSCL